jgi:hypothetical protein
LSIKELMAERVTERGFTLQKLNSVEGNWLSSRSCNLVL